mgnify:CR=1 FL=1
MLLKHIAVSRGDRFFTSPPPTRKLQPMHAGIATPTAPAISLSRYAPF